MGCAQTSFMLCADSEQDKLVGGGSERMASREISIIYRERCVQVQYRPLELASTVDLGRF